MLIHIFPLRVLGTCLGRSLEEVTEHVVLRVRSSVLLLLLLLLLMLNRGLGLWLLEHHVLHHQHHLLHHGHLLRLLALAIGHHSRHHLLHLKQLLLLLSLRVALMGHGRLNSWLVGLPHKNMSMGGRNWENLWDWLLVLCQFLLLLLHPLLLLLLEDDLSKWVLLSNSL
jgi:hypothetical protein